ncbi:MAG: hypothetical protein COX57_05775 [Alphaproteobacteria bacterium CG_4_10_14_0_2_um_filter_63_37]|nr:MAG: hypothetical protein COX57_05775 [Alphaproteobacteria bacterium CG_4_10_14_0_2_um_filter_63_37]
MLIDIGNLNEAQTGEALEGIYKAITSPPEAAAAAPHHDPVFRDVIEDYDSWGRRFLEVVFADVIAAISGRGVTSSRGLLAKAMGWTRWSDREMEEIEAELSAPSTYYTIEDWMKVVDLVIHRHLPRSVIMERAEMEAVRGVLLGELKASIEAGDTPPPTVAKMGVLVGGIPATLESAQKVGIIARGRIDAMTRGRIAAILFAKERAAESIRELGENARSAVKQMVIAHQEAAGRGDPAATIWALQSEMQDRLAILNRDWRRVAVTETGRNINEGFISTLQPGTKVKRIEAYIGVCPFCQSLNNRVFTVVSPSEPRKDGETQVWAGKTNVGRYAAPNQRVGGQLIPRSKDEMWWAAAGVQHPHCRGAWVLVPGTPVGADPEFVRWAKERLSGGGGVATHGD